MYFSIKTVYIYEFKPHIEVRYQNPLYCTQFYWKALASVFFEQWGPGLFAWLFWGCHPTTPLSKINKNCDWGKVKLFNRLCQFRPPTNIMCRFLAASANELGSSDVIIVIMIHFICNVLYNSRKSQSATAGKIA